MASADRNLERNKTLDSYLRYRKQLYGSKEKETLEDILDGTTIERVLRRCIRRLFVELKSLNDGHFDRLDTWPRWPGFRFAYASLLTVPSLSFVGR